MDWSIDLCQRWGDSNRRNGGIRDGLRGNRQKVSYGNIEHNKSKVEGRGNDEEDEWRCDGQMRNEEDVKG